MSGLERVSLETDCVNADFVLSARWETTVRSGQPVVSSGQQTMLSSRETQPECALCHTLALCGASFSKALESRVQLLRYRSTVRSGHLRATVRSGQFWSETSRERQRECVTSPTIIIILQQPAAGITTVTILNLPVSGAYTQLERRDL